MEIVDTLQINEKPKSIKAVAIKTSVFVFLIFFFTFIGSGIFNRLFVEPTVRIVIFLAFYMIIGAILGFMPFLFRRLEEKPKNEIRKVQKVQTVSKRKLLVHILTK